MSKIFSLQFYQAFRYASFMLISVFLAKIFGENTSIIASFEKLMVIGGLFTFFWISGFVQTFLPFYYASKNNEEKSRIIINAFISISFASIVTFFAMRYLGIYLFPNLNVSLLNAYSFYIAFNTPTLFTIYYFLVKNQNKSIFIYSLIIFSTNIIALILPLYLNLGLLNSIYFLVLISVLKYIFIFTKVFLEGNFFWDKTIIKAYFRKSFPIMLSFLVGRSADYTDSMIINYYFDDKEFAFFRYGARELPFVFILANSLSAVLSGEIAKNKDNLESSLKVLRQKSTKLMHILFPISLIFILFSAEIYEFIFNKNFIYSAKIFNIYILLIVSRLIFPQTIIIGLQKNNIIFGISILELLLNIILSLILVQYFGILGVAYATLIAYYFEKIMYIFINYISRIKPHNYINLKLWFAYSLMIWVAYFI